MRSLQRFLIAGAVLAATAVCGPPGASAAVSHDYSNDWRWGGRSTSPTGWVERLQPYVYREPGWMTWHFRRIPASVRAAVGSTRIHQVQHAFDLLLEAQQRANRTFAYRDGLVTWPSMRAQDSAQIVVTQRWFGFRVWLNDAAVSRLHAGMIETAGVIAAIGILITPLTRYLEPLAAIIVLAATYVWLCRNSATGNASIYMVWLYGGFNPFLFGPVGVYCNVFS